MIYKVEFMEIARDGIEQEQGCEFYAAESPEDAISQAQKDSQAAGAKTYNYSAAPASDGETRAYIDRQEEERRDRRLSAIGHYQRQNVDPQNLTD